MSKFSPFAAFALIWAITSLAHQLAFTFWAESWQGWLYVFSASVTVFRPTCVMRFGVLIFTSLLNLIHKLPFVPNHILYEGMLHLIMMFALVGFLLSRRGQDEWRQVRAGWRKYLPVLFFAILLKVIYFALPIIPHGYLLGALSTLFLVFALGRMLLRAPEMGGGDIYLARFAPIIRAGVVIMYFWAGLQKLNWDYINPDISCAAKLHTEIAAYFGSLIPTTGWALHGAIWGSYAFEFGIPLLLIFRRTRLIGFTAAVLFHLWLSIHPAAGIFSYSSIILALLSLFLPSSWGNEIQSIWSKQLNWLGGGNVKKGRKRAGWIAVGAFFVTLITQGLLYLLIDRSYEVFHTANRIGWVTFFIWGCWIGFCYLLAGWRARNEDGALPNKPSWSFAWIALIPIVLNGAHPWIGGRTQTSFSMYSNLRSEGQGNHLFLNRIDLFEFQGDMVEVVQSSPNILAPSNRPRGIQQFANIGHRIIPWFEFRRLVSEMPDDFEVTYMREGKTLELGMTDGKVYGDAEAFMPLPPLQRKLMWFRRLESLDQPMCCTH